MNIDGTRKWPPPDNLTPLDQVGLAAADVTKARAAEARARIHLDAARREHDTAHDILMGAIARLMEVARGGHR